MKARLIPSGVKQLSRTRRSLAKAIISAGEAEDARAQYILEQLRRRYLNFEALPDSDEELAAIGVMADAIYQRVIHGACTPD